MLDKTELVPASAAMPGIESAGKVFPTGGAFYILNTSEPAQQAASWKFLEFMLRPRSPRLGISTGATCRSSRPWRTTPRCRRSGATTSRARCCKPAVEQLSDADPDLPGPLIGPYVDEALAIENALDAVLFDNQDVDESLARAQDEVTQSLERYAGD